MFGCRRSRGTCLAADTRVTLLFTLGAAVVLALCLGLLYLALDRGFVAAFDDDLHHR